MHNTENTPGKIERDNPMTVATIETVFVSWFSHCSFSNENLIWYVQKPRPIEDTIHDIDDNNNDKRIERWATDFTCVRQPENSSKDKLILHTIICHVISGKVAYNSSSEEVSVILDGSVHNSILIFELFSKVCVTK